MQFSSLYFLDFYDGVAVSISIVVSIVALNVFLFLLSRLLVVVNDAAFDIKSSYKDNSNISITLSSSDCQLLLLLLELQKLIYLLLLVLLLSLSNSHHL